MCIDTLGISFNNFLLIRNLLRIIALVNSTIHTFLSRQTHNGVFLLRFVLSMRDRSAGLLISHYLSPLYHLYKLSLYVLSLHRIGSVCHISGEPIESCSLTFCEKAQKGGKQYLCLNEDVRDVRELTGRVYACSAVAFLLHF